MKAISRAIRVYIHKKGRVMIRVRWNRAKSECAFSTECNADPSKWNKEAGRAKLNTTHVVNGTTYSAKEINARIENAEDLINQAIYQFEVHDDHSYATVSPLAYQQMWFLLVLVMPI